MDLTHFTLNIIRLDWTL